MTIEIRSRAFLMTGGVLLAMQAVVTATQCHVFNVCLLATMACLAHIIRFQTCSLRMRAILAALSLAMYIDDSSLSFFWTAIWAIHCTLVFLIRFMFRFEGRPV